MEVNERGKLLSPRLRPFPGFYYKSFREGSRRVLMDTKTKRRAVPMEVRGPERLLVISLGPGT